MSASRVGPTSDFVRNKLVNLAIAAIVQRDCRPRVLTRPQMGGPLTRTRFALEIIATRATASELQLRFPVPSRYDSAAWLENEFLAGNAPWFQHKALERDRVAYRYAVDGAFPGEISLEATKS